MRGGRVSSVKKATRTEFNLRTHINIHGIVANTYNPRSREVAPERYLGFLSVWPASQPSPINYFQASEKSKNNVDTQEWHLTSLCKCSHVPIQTYIDINCNLKIKYI